MKELFPYHGEKILVTQEMCDHNGHMNTGSYTRCFDGCWGQMYTDMGFDDEYFNNGYSSFTLEENLKYFKDYEERLIILDNRNELIDFNIIKYFKNIAITNSTFNWWSCFFEEALKEKTLFTPKLIGYCGIGEKFKCHGAHVKNLCNIRDISIPMDNEFINLG